MKVRIGRFYSGAENSIGVHAELDIERLVESRAFIQASSGFGKSYLLCELIEATHGHIQQIIIDPEGEFSPLRANHDFVIASAHGGDALAHPRTAGLLATRLLETKASAILDIYDVKPRERHEFVRNFLVSMMEARKELWHPVLVFLDEAHLFCPEKGMGESEATDAVIDLAGRGRKRGFTLVAATQRIGKFNKSALAELHNKFIGFASLDTDVKRAAFELGKTPKDALDDFRTLKPGDFYAFGPALRVPSPCLFKGTLPQTKLPKAGHRKLVSPPKPTDKIRALLPQLSDLPKEVEQKAKTEADLRKDLGDVRRELETLKRTPSAPAAKDGKTGERLRLQALHINRLKAVVGRLMKFVVTINTIDKNNIHPDVVNNALKEVIDRASKLIDGRLEKCRKDIEEVRARSEALVLEVNKILKEDVNIELDVKVQEPFKIQVKAPKMINIVDTIRGTAKANDLTTPEKKILNAIAWMVAATGKETVTQTAAAFLANYTPGSSSFRNPRSALAAKELIEYDGKDLKLSSAGGMLAQHPVAQPTAEEIRVHVLSLLDGPEKKLLLDLIRTYPEGQTQEEHATNCNYTPGSSSYRNPRSHLAALELLRYEKPDKVFAEKWLFLE